MSTPASLLDDDLAQVDAPPARRSGTRRAPRFVLGLTGLAVLLGLWSLIANLLAGSTPLAAAMEPGATLRALAGLVADNRLTVHTLTSLKRVLVSLAAALACGIPIGIAVGAWQRFDAATGPSFQFLRMISPLSWMPIAVMAFGIGDAPIYFLLTITAVWPIVLNTAAGVRALDPHWLLLARSLGASRRETLTRFILPGVVGHILTGARVAIGMIWILLIPCEMLGVSSGLGYFILDTRDRLAYSELMAAIVVIGALGLALDAAAQALRARFAPGLMR